MITPQIIVQRFNGSKVQRETGSERMNFSPFISLFRK